MLGIVDQRRYNGLDHSPATRTRRSARMRVKRQLVMCSDEGHEESITGIFAYPPKYAVHRIFGDMQSPGICGVYCH